MRPRGGHTRAFGSSALTMALLLQLAGLAIPHMSVTGSPQDQTPAPTLSFEQIMLTFDPTSGGIVTIATPQDPFSAWFVNDTVGGAGVPLWRLHFADGGSIDSSRCSIAPTFSNGSRVIEWRGCVYATASMDVTVTWSPAMLPPRALALSRLPPQLPFGAEGRIYVSSSYAAPTSPLLSTVSFPILRLRRPPDPAADKIQLVWSREAGRSWRNPWDGPVGYGVGTQVGSQGPTQMGCVVTDDERGLYWATYDSSASLKHFYYINNKTKDGKSNGIVEVSVGHVYPASTKGGLLSYSPDYPTVLTTFRGDWWDAAMLYRDWALKQPWVPPRESPGSESWLKQTQVWVRGDTKHRADEVAGQQQTLMRYAKLFGVPLGVQLYDWANASVYRSADGNLSSSFTFPSRWPIQPGWDWKALKAHGIRVLPYVNSEQSNTGDANWVTDHGEAIAIRDASGNVLTSEDGSTPICASQSSWHTRMVNASVRLLTAGASGIYMDQSGNQAQMPCYARTHNHSLGGGSYGAHGLITMFGRVQKALRALDPEAILAGEVPPEEFLSTISLRLLHFNYWPGWVPLEQSIFSGYTTSFGRTIVLKGPEAAAGGLKTRVATMLHSGACFGRLWMDSWGDASYMKETTYLQQHISYRRQLSRFFVHGSLLRPVKAEVLKGPTTISLVPAEEIKHNVSAASFLASAWLSHNGTEMGLMISNLAEDKLELALEVELHRMWNESLRNQTLIASRLEYPGSPSDQLNSVPLCIPKLPCGIFPTEPGEPWRVKEKLGVGDAVFLNLQIA